MLLTLSWILTAALLLTGCYLFLIAPNVRKRKLRCPALIGHAYAHRGLHDEKGGIPENSLPAFRRAIIRGYGIELDVHLTRDGKLVVFHDQSLQRMCRDERDICDLSLEEIRALTLGETKEKIPTLDEVLSLVDGRAPLIIELKSDGKWGDCALPAALHERMQAYSGPYCVESFDPMMLRWYKKHAPQVIRGQLAFDQRVIKGEYRHVIMFAASHLLFNCLSRPDFVAYQYQCQKNLSFRVQRALFRPMLAAWTVRSKEDYQALQSQFDLQIFEAFEP